MEFDPTFYSPKDLNNSDFQQCVNAERTVSNLLTTAKLFEGGYAETALTVDNPNSRCFRQIVSGLKDSRWEVMAYAKQVKEVSVDLSSRKVHFTG